MSELLTSVRKPCRCPVPQQSIDPTKRSDHTMLGRLYLAPKPSWRCSARNSCSCVIYQRTWEHSAIPQQKYSRTTADEQKIELMENNTMSLCLVLEVALLRQTDKHQDSLKACHLLPKLQKLNINMTTEYIREHRRNEERAGYGIHEQFTQHDNSKMVADSKHEIFSLRYLCFVNHLLTDLTYQTARPDGL